MLQHGKYNRTAVVNYTPAYTSSLENIKSEPGLQQCAAQQIKTEPPAEYAGGYYAADADNSYDNYDLYYDQTAGMYTDPGGSFSNTGHFADDATDYGKPRPHKVLLVKLYSSLCHLANHLIIRPGTDINLYGILK